MPLRLLAVFVGGLGGGAVRWGLGGSRPGLVAVNAAGCFVLGLLLVAGPRSVLVRALLGAGFCGALTTFSGVVVPVAQDLDAGSWSTAAGFLGASLGTAALAVWAGWSLGAVLRPLPAVPDVEED